MCSSDCVDERNRIKAREWGLVNKDKVRVSNKKTQRKRIENGKMHSYQVARRNTKEGYIDRFMERIKANNPATDVTREYLSGLFGNSCIVTGVPFKFEREGKTSFENPYSPSIDRIDSKLPYQVGNIQVVLSAINFAKNAMSMKDFIKVWSDITRSWQALTQL